MSQPDECRFHVPAEIPRIFPTVQHHIKRALARGSVYTLQEIYQWLTQGKVTLWTYGDRAAMVAGIMGKDCVIMTLAGSDMSAWKHHIGEVEQWARERGCTHLLVHGRKGWTRLFGFTVEGRDELGLAVMRRAL